MRQALLLLFILCLGFAEKVDANPATNSNEMYIVCRNGLITHYTGLAKADDLQLNLPRNIIRDADLSQDGTKIVVAATSNPALRLIQTNPLKEIGSFNDTDLSQDLSGNSMPMFCVWLDNSTLLYRDERSGFPMIVNTVQGTALAAAGFPASAKDELVASPSGNVLLSLRSGEIYVYSLANERIIFATKCTPETQYWWEAEVDIAWPQSALQVLFTRVAQIPGDSMPLKVKVDWETGKVERSGGAVPNAVLKVLQSKRGKRFLMAYAYARGRAEKAYPVVYGPLMKALQIMNDDSLKNMPDLTRQAFLTPSGRTAAVVIYQEETDQKPQSSSVKILDLGTGVILHEVLLEQDIASILFGEIGK